MEYNLHKVLHMQFTHGNGGRYTQKYWSASDAARKLMKHSLRKTEQNSSEISTYGNTWNNICIIIITQNQHSMIPN